MKVSPCGEEEPAMKQELGRRQQMQVLLSEYTRLYADSYNSTTC